MNVCVVGLWHLGSVTAACLASAGHQVTGLDFSVSLVSGLSNARAPVMDPGLDDLLREGLSRGRLRFTTDPGTALEDADVVWVAYDTPVDNEDQADVEYVVGQTARTFPFVRDGALFVISSQLPVGTTARFERQFAEAAGGRSVGFAYAPENVRLGNAIATFRHPDGTVVGTRAAADRDKLSRLLCGVVPRIEWVSVESAEMIKHARNAFLATSVTFINEIAGVCEQVGADALEVERGLKQDSRIGPGAYVSPGAAFAGGTLARDVVFLSQLGRERRVNTDVISAVKTSNDRHRHWAERRLTDLVGDLTAATIAVWGLTYKPKTSTLRRSSAVELCQWMHEHGATVRAHDPAITRGAADLPPFIELTDTPVSATDRASALVVATPWPEYREISADEVRNRMKRPLVLDAGRFLSATFGDAASIEYVSVGKAPR